MHILSVLLILMSNSGPGDHQGKDCSNVKVEFSADTVSNEIRIELNVRGGKEPYYYFFFDKNNNPITWDFNKNYFQVTDNTGTPVYGKVRDSEGCLVRIDFKEKK